MICQEKGGRLHQVDFVETGKRMLNVAEKLSDQGFFLQLNNIPNSSDAVANDVQYHLKCWVCPRREVPKRTSELDELQELEDVTQGIADIEIMDPIWRMKM